MQPEKIQISPAITGRLNSLREMEGPRADSNGVLAGEFGGDRETASVQHLSAI